MDIVNDINTYFFVFDKIYKMKTKYTLLIILVAILIVLGITILFMSFQSDENIDSLYTQVCTPYKTYYSLNNQSNGTTYYANSKDCQKICSLSPECIGFLSDENDICYIFQNDDIKSNIDVQYGCRFPIRNEYNKLSNTDAWRWGGWKKDYPFPKSITKIEQGFWDVCNGKNSYWNFSQHSEHREHILASIDKCHDQCLNRKDDCLGWSYEEPDQCYLYHNLSTTKLGDFNYQCDNKSDGYWLGGWKAGVIPPEYIQKK